MTLPTPNTKPKGEADVETSTKVPATSADDAARNRNLKLLASGDADDPRVCDPMASVSPDLRTEPRIPVRFDLGALVLMIY